MMYGNNWGVGWNATPSYMLGGWLGGLTAWIGALLVTLVLWSLFWKGWALWKAAKADSKPWYIALLLVNTMGILDILYIFIFSKGKKSSKKR
jgi:hypothetical protein